MVTDDLTIQKHEAFDICIYHICLSCSRCTFFFFAIKAFLNDFIVETEHRGVVERPILTLCCDPACDLNSACVCVYT